MNNLIREKIFRILYKLKLGKIFDEDLLWYRRGKYKLGISLLNALNSDSKYSYIGYQYNKAEELQWILKFLEKNVPQYKRFDIRIYTVFISDVRAVKKDCKYYLGKKIFLSSENLEMYIKHKNLSINDYGWLSMINWRIKSYSDYLLRDVDLSLGFTKINNEKYLRFPAWIYYKNFFPADATYATIKKIVENVNSSRSLRKRECICINNHDAFGLRTKIADDLNGMFDITYAGRWRNNTSELWDKYGNDKLKYMNLFKFNICPENMDSPYYCTEKIFDSFRAGCIPIYAGALNNPEPDVINKDAVIFWNLDGDNTDNIKLIKKLNTDDNFYDKFMQQEKLLPSAAEYVYDRFIKLENKFKEILDD